MLMLILRTCSTPLPAVEGGFTPASGDTLNVAIDYSPMSLYRYGDTLGGFNYDLIRQVMANEKRPLKFHPIVALQQALEGLEKGSYDIIVADIPMTASYRDRYHFSEAVYLDRQMLVTADTTVHSQLDLGGRTITVPAGSPTVERLYSLGREIGDTIYVKQDSVHGAEQLFILAASGHVPAVAVNQELAKRMAPHYPNVHLSTALSFTRFQAWLVGTSDSLWLDSALVRFKSTPAYSTLLRRYDLKAAD